MKGRILVVDDDPILVMSLKLRLANAGFQVEEAENGNEAVGKIEEFEPDVILSDIMMPGIDGYALHRQLRENPDTAGIPFIFLTAKSDISDQLEGLRMGADDYVCKPFQIANLVERVERIMQRAETVKGYRSRADFSGNIPRMTWSDILQIVELNFKSGELILRNAENERVGGAFFHNGKIVNAKTADFEGEEAFFALMSEPEGSFEFFGKTGDSPRLIDSSNASVILNGSRMADETTDLLRAFSQFKVSRKTEECQIPAEIEEKVGKDRIARFLSELEKSPSVRQLVYSGHISPIRAGALISLLAKEKAVSMEDPDAVGIAKVSTAPSSLSLEEGLVKVLGIIQKRRHTGLLQFNNRSLRQALFFQEGQLVHAFHGKVSGKKAAFRIFRERGGTLKFFQQPVAVLNTINSSLSTLLDEGGKEIRQLKTLEKDFFEKKVAVDSEKVQETFKNKNLPGLRTFISLVQQYGKVSDIVDSSELTDGRTVEQLRYLINVGLLKVLGKRKAPIRVMTDSTADIPPEIAASHNIVVAPLSIHFGRTVYKDGATITPDSFYEMLRSSTTFPHTSPPSLVEFHQLFKTITADSDILGIFLSRKMSKTFENASAVKDGNYDEYLQTRRGKHGGGESLNIEIVDSKLVSLGMALLAFEAVEKIEKGWPLDRTVSYINKAREKVRTYFVVDTLEYLRRNGRIGKARALIGAILRFKPILGIENGEVTPVTRVRGGKNAQQRVIQIIREELENPMAPIRVGVFHADALKWAERLRDLLDMNFNCRSIVISQIGPTVGTHCGPGTVGMAYLPVEDET